MSIKMFTLVTIPSIFLHKRENSLQFSCAFTVKMRVREEMRLNKTRITLFHLWIYMSNEIQWVLINSEENVNINLFVCVCANIHASNVWNVGKKYFLLWFSKIVSSLAEDPQHTVCIWQVYLVSFAIVCVGFQFDENITEAQK